MAGLLDGVLPYLYSQSDRAKRYVGGLLADPAGTMERTAGGLLDADREQRGLLGQAFADPKRPFAMTDKQAMGRAVDNAFGLLSFAPVGMTKAAAPVALDMSEAARMQRAAQQGFEGGWWRGGKSVADGPHYTPDKTAAMDFGKRHGPAADVREYAINPGNQFSLAKTYAPADLNVLRDVLRRDYGAKNADELLSIPSDFKGGRAPGGHIWQAVEYLSGGNGKDALKAAGFDTINAGQELIVLNKAGTVRAKDSARFDPKQRFSADPFAAFAGSAVGLGLLGNSFEGE